MSFKELGLHPTLLARCAALGFSEPTPIQTAAIPLVLDYEDVIACAETGTGKTAAFVLPIIQDLIETGLEGTSVLVLAPTRELAIQIEQVCVDFAPKGIRCACLIGGAGYAKQQNALRKRAQIIVATPGRLVDFMERGEVDFSNLTTLVLDEADRMLDMGFLPTIRRIVNTLPEERQTLLFSATISPEIEKIAQTMMADPEFIEVTRRGSVTHLVEQTVYPVAPHSKMVLLLDLLEREKFERVLVFTRTKRGADRLAHVLEKRAHRSTRIHGDRSQSQREAALESFKTGRTRVLVATDIAARGIDIDSVSHVINYDVPAVPEDYVHRIGRTGRAGKTGRAITLLATGEEHAMRAIEKLTGQEVERVLLPDFGGQIAAPLLNPRPAASRGFRSFRSRRGR